MVLLSEVLFTRGLKIFLKFQLSRIPNHQHYLLLKFNHQHCHGSMILLPTSCQVTVALMLHHNARCSPHFIPSHRRCVIPHYHSEKGEYSTVRYPYPKLITFHFHFSNDHHVVWCFWLMTQERKPNSSPATCLREVKHICILKETLQAREHRRSIVRGCNWTEKHCPVGPSELFPELGLQCRHISDWPGTKACGNTLTSGVICALGPQEYP